MDKETKNTGDKETAVNNPPEPQKKEAAQERLLREVTKASPVSNTRDDESTEEEFIDFVAQKSQEIPEEKKPAGADVPADTAQETEKKEREKEREKRQSIIRTYHTDAADIIRKQNMSLARIAAAEDAAQGTRPTPTVMPKAKLPRRQLILIATSGVLVLGAVVLLAILYITYGREELPKATPTDSLVRANQETTIVTEGLSRDQLITAIKEVAQDFDLGLNDIGTIQLVESDTGGQISAQALLALLDTNIGAALLRSIEEPFMLGVHMTPSGAHTFLILQTTFFENAFAGMLQWEDRLLADLPFLVRDVQQAMREEVGTSTPTTTISVTPLISDSFQDVVINNKDSRAHFGSDGQYDILYSFADAETLVITSSETTLREIFNRLIVSQFQ